MKDNETVALLVLKACVNSMKDIESLNFCENATVGRRPEDSALPSLKSSMCILRYDRPTRRCISSLLRMYPDSVIVQFNRSESESDQVSAAYFAMYPVPKLFRSTLTLNSLSSFIEWSCSLPPLTLERFRSASIMNPRSWWCSTTILTNR